MSAAEEGRYDRGLRPASPGAHSDAQRRDGTVVSAWPGRGAPQAQRPAQIGACIRQRSILSQESAGSRCTSICARSSSLAFANALADVGLGKVGTAWMGPRRLARRPCSGLAEFSVVRRDVHIGICLLRRTGRVPRGSEVDPAWAYSKTRWKVSPLQVRLAKHKAAVPGSIVLAFLSRVRARAHASCAYALACAHVAARMSTCMSKHASNTLCTHVLEHSYTDVYTHACR